ncbi:Uncharacterized protein DBV15_00669 [Temnothorax longispinosus]|uniref:Uncharacterized protein n=1 Tax=Temnothorax longispinosus TaxID=300112 RepID=A0A4S2KNQ0_9HYME|nr:Uncharacterized protein DBV15_00669 [Temnothorax longispinosus]
MLIKAKERKTLVSPAKGVASQEMAGLSAPPSAISIGYHHHRRRWIYRGERVPGFLSCGNYDGFTTYRLSVVMKWPMLGSRLLLGRLLGHRLVDCLSRPGGGRKGETRRQVRNTAEQLRHGNRCSVAALF